MYLAVFTDPKKASARRLKSGSSRRRMKPRFTMMISFLRGEEQLRCGKGIEIDDRKAFIKPNPPALEEEEADGSRRT